MINGDMEFTRMLKSLMAVMMAAQVRQEFCTKVSLEPLIMLYYKILGWEGVLIHALYFLVLYSSSR